MKKTGRARGYALMLVLMVLFILSLSLGTLAWHLGGNVAETRRAIATIRTDSACAAALDLAGRQIEQRLRADPSTSADALTSHLCSLGPCDTADGMRLPRYLAPAGTTLAHFAVALSRPVRATTKNVATGPFRGHVAVEQTLTVVVGVKDAITGRGCSATDRFAIPSLPLTTFEMFGTAPTTRWSPPLSVRRTNDGSPSPIHVNGNTAGSQLSTGDFVLPAAQFPPEPLPIDLVRSTRGSDQVLRPAVAPGPQSSAQAGLPHSLRWLVEPPRSTDSEELRRTRLAQVADVVIVDGVWYDHRDKTLPWPGRPISSDLGGSNRTHPPPADSLVQSSATIGVGDLPFAVAGTSPLLYSWYDRDLGNDRIAFQTGGGVLSYGPLATIALGGSCLVDADCASFGPDAECFRSSSAAGSCIRVEPGLWPAPGTTCEQGNSFRGISQCPAASHAEALADGARSGFRDDDTNILPINLNVRTLAAALASTSDHELGPVLGVPAGGAARFNGVIYVTSRFTGASYPDQTQNHDGVGPRPLCFRSNGSGPSFGACPPAAAPSVHEPRAQFAVPVGLCGAPLSGTGADDFGVQDCAHASRPNAVRVHGAGFVDPSVFPKGLTIATDLPAYVYGDLNRVQLVGGVPQRQVKVAVVADRVTFLSRGWRDVEHPWNDVPATTLTVTGVQIVEASIVTGMPLRAGTIHDIADAFRALQTFNDNHFVLRGHIAMAFNSEWQADTDTAHQVGRGLRWLPDFHLENPAFQPPGMPLVVLPPSGRWRQR
jgi:hypothetical protein